jgi:hypothetical protein
LLGEDVGLGDLVVEQGRCARGRGAFAAEVGEGGDVVGHLLKFTPG